MRVLAAWVNHLRGAGAPVKDAAADQITILAQGALTEAVSKILGYLDPTLATDHALIDAVAAACHELPGQ